MNLAIKVYGDDSHSGGETPHRLSKFGCTQAHSAKAVLRPRPPTLARRRLAGVNGRHRLLMTVEHEQSGSADFAGTWVVWAKQTHLPTMKQSGIFHSSVDTRQRASGLLS